jgi:hypothetical protein
MGFWSVIYVLVMRIATANLDNRWLMSTLRKSESPTRDFFQLMKTIGVYAGYRLLKVKLIKPWAFGLLR